MLTAPCSPLKAPAEILDQENSSRRAAPLDLRTVYSSPNESDDTLASLPARSPGAEFEDSSVVSEIGVTV